MEERARHVDDSLFYGCAHSHLTTHLSSFQEIPCEGPRIGTLAGEAVACSNMCPQIHS